MIIYLFHTGKEFWFDPVTEDFTSAVPLDFFNTEWYQKPENKRFIRVDYYNDPELVQVSPRSGNPDIVEALDRKEILKQMLAWARTFTMHYQELHNYFRENPGYHHYIFIKSPSEYHKIDNLGLWYRVLTVSSDACFAIFLRLSEDDKTLLTLAFGKIYDAQALKNIDPAKVYQKFGWNTDIPRVEYYPLNN